MRAGAALVAFLCVCSVLFGLVWHKRSDRVPVEVFTQSPVDDGSDKVTWSIMRPVEPSGIGIAGFTEPTRPTHPLGGALDSAAVAAPPPPTPLSVQGSASSASSVPGQREFWAALGLPDGGSYSQSLLRPKGATGRPHSREREPVWCAAPIHIP